MADFKKIIEHPEHQSIIDKLLMGEKPSDIASYLKYKYDKPDENHLRLSASLLDQFLKTYLNASEFVDKLVKDSKSNSLDKQIPASLLNNSTWQERIANLADDKINIEKKLIQHMELLERRMEQIYDKIQENPGNTKLDYVLTKYFELSSIHMEKIDKIVNKSPDQRIEHTYSVQMISEHSNAIQEALRKVISRLPPEQSFEIMQMLNEELSSLKTSAPQVLTPKMISKEVEIIDSKIEKLEKEFTAEFEDE